VHIETEEFVAIKASQHSELGWCARCQRRVQMATADEAAQLARVSPRTIYHWVDSGKFHFTETPAGLLLICRDSLLGCLSALHHASGSADGERGMEP
jgi:helix-turn-helix protein